MYIRTFFPHNDLWSHVSAFSCYSQILAVRRNIIIVTNQHITSLRIYKEVTIIQILITETASVEFSESISNAKSRIDECIYACKFCFCQQEKREILIFRRPKLHKIPKTPLKILSYFKRPQEGTRRCSLLNIVLDISVKLICIAQLVTKVPLQSQLLTVIIHFVNNTLTTFTKLLQHFKFST